MVAPFVISMKFTSDASGVKADNAELVQQQGRLGAALEASRGKAVALQTALESRTSATSMVSAYASTIELIQAERQLEGQRLQAQISETGRAQSLNRLAQLSRDAASASQALAAAEAQVSTAQQMVEQSAAGAASAVARLGDQQARVSALQATGINQRIGVRDDFDTSRRAADIEAYGHELDQLRARYNPIFALEQKRAGSLADIRSAHRVGAISAKEMAEAVKMEEAAFVRSVAAINNSTDALQRNQVMAANGASQFNTANVAAQFQDIAVTSAMGMNPLQIALQQGTQLSAVFGNMGAAGAVKTLGAAFLSVVSPVSLTTIALVGGTAAALQFFGSLINNSKDAADALEKHKERLDELLAGYDDAKDAADQLLERRERRPEAAVVSELDVSRTNALKAYKLLLAEVAAEQAKFQVDVDLTKQSGGEAEFIATMQRVLDIVTQAGLGADTSASQFDALISALTLIKNSGADASVAGIAEGMLGLVQTASQAKDIVDSLAASLDSIDRDIQVSMRVSYSDAMSEMSDLFIDPRSQFDQKREQLDAWALQAKSTGQTYTEMVEFANEYKRVKDSIDAAEATADAKTAARASKQVSPYERQLKTIRERIATQELETNVVGLGTYASERARMALELENAAREDGIGLSARRIAEIDKEASAYARVTATLERQQSAHDLVSSTAENSIDSIVNSVLEAEGSILDVFGNIAKEWARTLLEMSVSNPIKNALLGQNNPTLNDAGGWLGSIISGIFGGGGNSIGGTAGAPALQLGYQVGVPGYSNGGWTGGVAGQKAGDVHGEEFVVRAGPAAQHRQALEALNAGGSLGGNVTVINETQIINNHSGANVTKRETSNGKGGKRQEIIIDEIVGGAIGRRGGVSQNSLAFAGMLPKR